MKILQNTCTVVVVVVVVHIENTYTLKLRTIRSSDIGVIDS